MAPVYSIGKHGSSLGEPRLTGHITQYMSLADDDDGNTP